MVVKIVVIDNEKEEIVDQVEFYSSNFDNLDILAEKVAATILELENKFPADKYSIEQLISYGN